MLFSIILLHETVSISFSKSVDKGDVLLRRELSLKIAFQIVISAKISVIMNGHTYTCTLFKNIFNGIQTKGK